jgi:hypothetical protein
MYVFALSFLTNLASTSSPFPNFKVIMSFSFIFSFMFENIKENDIITLKLGNGEEVLAKFVRKDSANTYIEVVKGLVLMQGPQGVALGSFFSTANPDKPIKVKIANIMCVSEINPKLVDQYNNVFSKIKTQAKPTIIT